MGIVPAARVEQILMCSVVRPRICIFGPLIVVFIASWAYRLTSLDFQYRPWTALPLRLAGRNLKSSTGRGRNRSFLPSGSFGFWSRSWWDSRWCNPSRLLGYPHRTLRFETGPNLSISLDTEPSASYFFLLRWEQPVERRPTIDLEHLTLFWLNQRGNICGETGNTQYPTLRGCKTCNLNTTCRPQSSAELKTGTLLRAWRLEDRDNRRRERFECARSTSGRISITDGALRYSEDTYVKSVWHRSFSSCCVTRLSTEQSEAVFQPVIHEIERKSRCGRLTKPSALPRSGASSNFPRLQKWNLSNPKIRSHWWVPKRSLHYRRHRTLYLKSHGCPLHSHNPRIRQIREGCQDYETQTLARLWAVSRSFLNALCQIFGLFR